MASKSIKIKEYIDNNKNRNIYAVANEALLKIFGDEDTYTRYILAKFNKNINRAFCATRKDGLYVSVECALRNFNGDYKDFVECHNGYKLGYNVVSDAFDTLFKLELRAFCCGVVDTKDMIAKKSYYSRYGYEYGIVKTPAVIAPNKLHPNYQVLEEITFDRKNMLPYIYMDTNTLSAFVQFRAMVYDKYKENLENGFMERSKQICPYGFSNMNRNEYVAYALAIKDTCEFFSKFYGPDKVCFSTTKLPFSLAVLDQKVGELKTLTNIETIGTLRHFESSKNLPMLNPQRYSNHAVCNAITKMVVLSGKFVPSDEYKQALRDVKDIIEPHYDTNYNYKGINMGVTSVNPAPVEEIKHEVQTNDAIQQALQTTTKTIKREYTFAYTSDIERKATYADEMVKKIVGVRATATTSVSVLQSVKFDVNKLRENVSLQIPMFLQYSKGNKTIFVNNVTAYVESSQVDGAIDSYIKTINTLSALQQSFESLRYHATMVKTSAKEVAEAEEDLEWFEGLDKEDKREPNEIYVITDYLTEEKRHGSYEEKELNDAKRGYREAYDKYVKAEKQVTELMQEYRKSLEITTVKFEELIKTEGFNRDDFAGAIEVIDTLNQAQQNIITDNNLPS